MTLNRIIIGGNLVRDPELRQTAQGVSVCSISIAVHRIAKEDKQGNKRTSWEIAADEVTVVSSKQSATEAAPVQNQPCMPSAYANQPSQPSLIPGPNARGGKQMQMPLAPPINQQFEEIPSDEGLPF